MKNIFRILISSFVAVTCFHPALAVEEIAGPVQAEILRVIDGDTLLVEASPWPQQRMEVYVRLRGIDAPEMHSKCPEARIAALDARHALEKMTASSPVIQLSRIAGDKYFGRILAHVTLANGEDLAQQLLDQGLVREYDGGRKAKPVCLHASYEP